MTTEITIETVQDWLICRFAEIADIDKQSVELDKGLDEQDFLSLDVVHITAGAMKHFGAKLKREQLQSIGTIRNLSDLIYGNLAG